MGHINASSKKAFSPLENLPLGEERKEHWRVESAKDQEQPWAQEGKPHKQYAAVQSHSSEYVWEVL